MPAAPDPFNWARLLGPMPPMATAGMETEAQMPPSSSGVRRWAPGLVDGFGRGPDDKVRARPPADMRHRQVLTAHVDAVCPAGQGQVHLVVEDQGDVIPVAQGLDFQGLCQEGGWVQVFFPELDQGDTALEGGLQLLQQGLPPGPGPVGDSVKEKLIRVKWHGKSSFPTCAGRMRGRDRS